ncbi:MAG: helix-turn-helix transcriptional regulator [Firmicutes bacterium]|uniref:Transcriptional regulator n=1 Tax=Sulfobacillus benefaciens TaxID=453960 RepID=A0A2T2WRW8_9FIRM|nr:helix-turn-helix transcriptional regulator [Bacillota bacterium]MCL5015901.1 helix-turn-helix transcriptional regulator [Bacillota bacterium]PSR24981.1 MAG: transcriptional regulator [Sulfobacillus benefaciens]HBQ96061.1 transcriptional regulator [Sulfobacillus sp.]
MDNLGEHNRHCPVARTAALVGDTYILLILRDLSDGPRRFGDLERSVEASPRTLTSRLRQMEAEGIIVRHVFAEIPPRVEYELTTKGRALAPIVESLRQFGETWLLDDGQSQTR